MHYYERIGLVIQTEKREAAQPAQSVSQTPIPQYPPLFEVIWKICDSGVSGKKDANGCVSNKAYPLRLWGPVGEAKLAKGTYPDFRNQPTVDRKVAISSKGCYPEYKQPSVEQLYSADTKVFIKTGSSPKLELITKQLDNKLVHTLLTGIKTAPGIATFSSGDCKPIK